MATRAGVYLSLVGLLWASSVVGQSLFKCTDASGKVSYQQRKCDGNGAELEATPANQQYREPAVINGSVKVPASKAPEPAPAGPAAKETIGPAAALPSKTPPEAKGRLDGWPKSGNGLSEGMLPSAVIAQWGRPHKYNIFDANGMYFDYCDYRIAYFWKGKLVAWAASDPESRAGTHLFKYGEPWIAAPQRWGIERDRKTYAYSASDHGDVQTWGGHRWIVADAQGNIVSWCDAGLAGSAMPPPTHKTPWEK